jgi:hypothetical protein
MCVCGGVCICGCVRVSMTESSNYPHVEAVPSSIHGFISRDVALCRLFHGYRNFGGTLKMEAVLLLV